MPEADSPAVVMTRQATADAETALRRAKARRNAALLALLAFGLYAGFIALQVLHARRG